MMELFLELSPDFGDIHTVVWDGPEEDVLLLDRSFTAMSWDSFYWVPTYGIWLRSFDQSKAYDELRQWLQVLQHQDPTRAGKRWVLKSPHHLTAADTVLDAFPECKIVMTHRSPTSAVPSYASMVPAMTAQYSDSADPKLIGPYWNDRFVECLTGFDEVRARAARPVRRRAVQGDRRASRSRRRQRVLSQLGLAGRRRGRTGLRGLPRGQPPGAARLAQLHRRGLRALDRAARAATSRSTRGTTCDPEGRGRRHHRRRCRARRQAGQRAVAEGAKVVMAARSGTVTEQIEKETDGAAVAVAVRRAQGGGLRARHRHRPRALRQGHRAGQQRLRAPRLPRPARDARQGAAPLDGRHPARRRCRWPGSPYRT